MASELKRIFLIETAAISVLFGFSVLLAPYSGKFRLIILMGTAIALYRPYLNRYVIKRLNEKLHLDFNCMYLAESFLLIILVSSGLSMTLYSNVNHILHWLILVIVFLIPRTLIFLYFRKHRNELER